MANHKKKVTEDTIVYIGDIKGTAEFLLEEVREIESALGLNDIEGGYRKVNDPEAFQELIDDIAGKIFEQHTRLQTEVFSKLGSEQQK
jgi:hypothetical protein